MQDFPGLFNIQVSSEHRSYFRFTRDYKIFQLHYGTVTQRTNMGLATGGMPPVRMQYNNVGVQINTGNGSGVSDDCAILSDKNCN
jgi:hypothetical protein